MTACATSKNLSERHLTGNLFLPVPDTDFRDYLDKIAEIALFAPEIIQEINVDLDNHAKKKKRLRLADKRFFESQTADLPGLEIEKQELCAKELNLEIGCPRMSEYAVYVFLMLRGFLGSLTSVPAQRFLRESISLYAFMQERGLKIPAITTIFENVNAVSHATRTLVFDKQIELVLKENLDDFKRLTIDSTAVKANSSWPTDAQVLTRLLQRAYSLGQKLHLFGVENYNKGWAPHWLEDMDKLVFQICLVAGKANSRGKLKKGYRKILKLGQKVSKFLTAENNRLIQDLVMESIPPSRRVLLQRILDQISNDLGDATKVLKYADDRVFHDKKLPSTEKVLSLSDGSAAYIKKGNRNPVIGYKPQLVRSANGFVTSLIVPEGNAADSVKLVPAIQNSIKRTGVIAELVSTDDGYASKNGRDKVLEMGVKDVSISGAKGKKLTSIDDWNSETYQDARRDRSAVESLMFTIKDGFSFGVLGRRGIDAVRDELLEKVLAYNCCRIILLENRRREKQRMAA